MNEKALPVKVTYARTGMLEADLANKQILMHLYGARYQERDSKDPFNLHKIRDGINMVEGTLPISLEELYEKEKTTEPFRSVDRAIAGATQEREHTGTQRQPHGNQQTIFVSVRVRGFAIIGVPLGVTAHRRETSIGFAMGLIVATTYFLFVIVGDTLRGNPHAHPELLVWFPNVLFIVLGVFYSAVSRGNKSKSRNIVATALGRLPHEQAAHRWDRACGSSISATRRLGSGRIDNRADLGNPVRGKTALPGVFANQFLVGRDVNAINPDRPSRRLSTH